MTNQQKQNDFISEAECSDISAVMTKKYSAFLGDRSFIISAEHLCDNKNGENPTLEYVYVKVLLKNQSESFYYPVEGRIPLTENQTKREATLFLFDYIDFYFEEYLMGDSDVYIPIDWTNFECEGFQFQLKGQVLNMELEKKADTLLTTN